MALNLGGLGFGATAAAQGLAGYLGGREQRRREDAEQAAIDRRQALEEELLKWRQRQYAKEQANAQANANAKAQSSVADEAKVAASAAWYKSQYPELAQSGLPDEEIVRLGRARDESGLIKGRQREPSGDMPADNTRFLTGQIMDYYNAARARGETITMDQAREHVMNAYGLAGGTAPKAVGGTGTTSVVGQALERNPIAQRGAMPNQTGFQWPTPQRGTGERLMRPGISRSRSMEARPEDMQGVGQGLDSGAVEAITAEYRQNPKVGLQVLQAMLQQGTINQATYDAAARKLQPQGGVGGRF